jgi:DNA-binding NtrC family response regulator
MQGALSILVMDKDDRTVQIVADAVKDYPSKIVCCSSREALLEAALQAEAVDVVILDFQQPFEESFDLLSHLKAELPQTEIVFASRFDDEKLWMEAVQRGAYDFLPKPLGLSELKRILIQATEKHHPLTAIGSTGAEKSNAAMV